MSKIFNLSKLRINKSIQSRFLSGSVLLPNHQQITNLILEQKSANQALQTFEWASKIHGFIHTTSTYRALIHKLCTFRKFEIVEQLLDEMPNSIDMTPDDDIFITIVRGFAQFKMIRQVIGVLDLVSKFGKSKPSLKLLNSILDVLVKEDIDIAREFYRKKMMGNGVKGDDYTYGILMKGFCLTNRIGDGFKLLQALKTHGLKPNVVVYNTLIYALCKNGKVGRARSLMNEMEKYSDVTFNILISTYCNENKILQALVMMDKCFSFGFVPDVVTMTKVVEVLGNAGRASEAVEILERVEENGGTIDVVTYNTLIKGFVKARKVKVGCGFLKQMEMKGCLPNTATYNILIAGLCEYEMLDSALDMFHEMKRVGVKHNFATFERLIHSLCSCGRIGDGFKLLESMSECKESFGGGIGPYNSILYGLYKENCLDKANNFLTYMKHYFPRVVERTLTIIRFSEEGDLEESKNILAKLREEGGIPSALIYASLIPLFCRNKYMKESVELMNEMIGLGYFPIASTFNALVSGFCQQGKPGTALRLLEDLEMRGCLLDSESYGLVMNGFCSQGDMEQALVLLMQMVEKGLLPNYYSWKALVLLRLEGKNMYQEHKLMQSLTDILHV